MSYDVLGHPLAIIYGERVFACRHCHKLVCVSQRQNSAERSVQKGNKIREKLGWEPGLLTGRGWQKPKGMHWKTFAQLCSQHDAIADMSLARLKM